MATMELQDAQADSLDVSEATMARLQEALRAMVAQHQELAAALGESQRGIDRQQGAVALMQRLLAKTPPTPP